MSNCQLQRAAPNKIASTDVEIVQAMGSLQAGDVLGVSAGAYDIPVLYTAQSDVTIQAQGQVTLTATASNSGFNIEGSRVDVLDFEIDGSGIADTAIQHYGDGGSVDGNTVHGFSNQGIFVSYALCGSGHEVIRNHVYDIGSGTASLNHGIYYNSYNGRVGGNHVHDCSGSCIQLWERVANTLVDNNTVYRAGNWLIVYGRGANPYPNCFGIPADTINNVFVNNLMFDSPVGFNAFPLNYTTQNILDTNWMFNVGTEYQGVDSPIINPLTGDPLVNADGTLQDNSPLKDIGNTGYSTAQDYVDVFGGCRLQGQIDIGAFEIQADSQFSNWQCGSAVN